jgi:hypothetical protein
MTPEQLEDAVAAGAAKAVKEATAARKAPAPWKKITVAASAVTAIFVAGAAVWALLGDVAIIPRAEADKIHREHSAEIRKHEKAIRYGHEFTSTMDRNVRAIGSRLGVQMEPPPQPDLLAR